MARKSGMGSLPLDFMRGTGWDGERGGRESGSVDTVVLLVDVGMDEPDNDGAGDIGGGSESPSVVEVVLRAAAHEDV